MIGLTHMQKRFTSSIAMAGLFALAMSAPAMADDQASGLGQSWPNAQDQSINPNYHVYVFNKDGVNYVQVNDAAGKVRAAVAASGGQFLVLPLGSDAARVSTPQSEATQAPAGVQAAGAPQTVYQDSASQTQVTVTPLSNGTLMLRAAAACSDPALCGNSLQAR